MPVVASVAAWIFLGQPLGWPVVVGGLVVLGATAVVVVRVARRESGEADPDDPPLIADPAG